jgi:hypothetical protein
MSTQPLPHFSSNFLRPGQRRGASNPRVWIGLLAALALSLGAIGDATPVAEAQSPNLAITKNAMGFFPAPQQGREYRLQARNTGGSPAAGQVIHITGGVATTDELGALQRECRRGYVEPSLMQYAVRLAAATRDPEQYGIKDLARYLTYGASPRASIHMIEAARALAHLRGRNYVLPEDVTDLAPDVLRHRLVLSYEALSDALSPDELVQRIMRQIAAPQKPLEHVRAAAAGA